MSESRSFLSTSSSKYKHSIVKGPISTLKQEKNKSKPITKQRFLRCPQKCNRHLFSMMKCNSNYQNSAFTIEKYGISHSFCPTYNQQAIIKNRLIGVYEGGIPEFNSDKSIETPTFLSKCEKSDDQKISNKFYQQRFRENLAKATDSTAEDPQAYRIERNSLKKIKKVKDQSLNQVLIFFKTILETKQKRGEAKLCE